MYSRALIFLLFFIVFFHKNSFAQNITPDSLLVPSDKKVTTYKLGKEQHYVLKDSTVLIYKKPRYFSFVTNLPKDMWEIAKEPFKKENLVSNVIIAGTTGVLLLADEPLIDGVRNLSDKINLSPETIFKDAFSIKAGSTDIKILRLPQNLNTAIYQLGQGFPALLIGGGLYISGKLRNNYRDLSTASQLAESFFLMGAYTQLIKRTTGRQTPSEATVPGGKWQPFPSFSNYQKHTSKYDAFPSGHMATMMSAVTILSENYPEKKYIRPVGYSLMGLLGYAMMNNKVHWASDYPLAIALGYVSAKQVVKRNKRELKPNSHSKPKTKLNYTLSRINGVITPGVVLSF